LRAFFESEKHNFEIVGINDLSDIDTAIHLLKYDSSHGKFNLKVEKLSGTELLIHDKKISYISQKLPEKLPWKDLGIDLVFECTGMFNKKILCQSHIAAGAKKVLISCPAEDVDRTVIYGVNSESIDKENDIILSNASCTTNCIAPIVKVIAGSVGIQNGFVTTIHSYTGDQRLTDMYHKDQRRTRAANVNMIPTSTGATKSIEKIFPELKGKLSGLSVRVPTPNVSMIDFTFTSTKVTTAEEINDIIRKCSEHKLKGILNYTTENLVSCDFNHDPHSAIVDLQLTKVVDGNLCHVVAWYDNEWGFSNRMLDVASKLF
jgi:glyceraldehyde 3-phosphate dehydrogenase